jgi:hypothetical protein
MAIPLTTDASNPDTGAPQSESTTALLRRLMHELATLFRQELRLATVELTGALSRFVAGLTSIAVGASVLYAGLLFLLAAAAFGLAQVLSPWLAVLIVGMAASLVGVVMVFAGLKAAEPLNLKPKRSPQSLHQDKDTLTRKKS